MFPILHLCQAAQVTRSFAVSHSIQFFRKNIKYIETHCIFHVVSKIA